ncbi:MAG: hypothetical protein AAGI72_24650, partial [Pseudomonadota bacterium]
MSSALTASQVLGGDFFEQLIWNFEDNTYTWADSGVALGGGIGIACNALLNTVVAQAPSFHAYLISANNKADTNPFDFEYGLGLHPFQFVSSPSAVTGFTVVNPGIHCETATRAYYQVTNGHSYPSCTIADSLSGGYVLYAETLTVGGTFVLDSLAGVDPFPVLTLASVHREGDPADGWTLELTVNRSDLSQAFVLRGPRGFSQVLAVNPVSVGSSYVSVVLSASISALSFTGTAGPTDTETCEVTVNGQHFVIQTPALNAAPSAGMTCSLTNRANVENPGRYTYLESYCLQSPASINGLLAQSVLDSTPDAIVKGDLFAATCLQYGFTPGWQTRYIDTLAGGIAEETFEQATAANKLYIDYAEQGQEEDMFFTTLERGVFESDQAIDNLGTGKPYYVERTDIDLDDLVPDWTTDMMKHIRQFVFHLKSTALQGGAVEGVNEFEFSTGWAQNLMDAPSMNTAIPVSLQTSASGGRYKV